MRVTRRQAIAATGAVLLAPSARAAAWPEREITILVQYGAGGSTDVSVRAVAAEAEKILGVPVQVVNRPGGQGTVAPQQVAVARADGHTIGSAGLVSLAIAPHMMSVPYTLDSFAYLPGCARYLYGIGVRAESPYRTIGDLVEAARTRRIPFGAAGPPNNLGMFEINRKTGGRFQFIPFPSGAEAVTATMGGHVEAVVQAPPEMLPVIQSGRLRLLASASAARWKEMPDVPTLREAGLDVVIDSVVGFIAPQGVPADRLEVLSRALIQAARAPAVAETLDRFGMVPAPLEATELERVMRDSHARFGPELADAGLARR